MIDVDFVEAVPTKSPTVSYPEPARLLAEMVENAITSDGGAG